MAYAAGFEYDVFISYAAVDDGALSEVRGQGWVSAFVESFESILAIRLGGRDKLRIYFDRRNLAGNHQLQELITAVRSSALFLSIASPAYAKRDWTRQELAAFSDTNSDTRRLFAAEFLPLDEGEHYPAPLDRQKRLKFWEQDTTASLAAMPMMGSHESYRSRMHDLADQVKKQLAAMNNAEAARPAIRQAAGEIARDAAQQDKGTVFLAQTTDDLEEERLQVQRYLEQFNIHVLPAADLPGGGDAFLDAVTADIAEADLYIHLLGPRGGRVPADLPDGYGLAQFNAAKAAGKDMLLWRHPGLDVEGVADPRQKTLLSEQDVIASSLQQLKDEARRRLAVQAKSQVAKPKKQSFVFVNAMQSDREIAKIVQQEFASFNMSVAIPLYTGPSAELQKNNAESMQDCDVMVFIYGEAPPTWLHGQMRMFLKNRTDGAARMVSIFVGPPDQKPADLDFTMPDLRQYDFRHGWSAEEIRRAVREMGL